MSTETIHEGITCDGCGLCPLVGIRYKSKQIYDYDICRDCMAEIDQADKDNFAAIKTPLPKPEADLLGPKEDNVIRAGSLRRAATMIGRDDPTRFAALHMWGLLDDHSDDLRSALASNANLRVLHIHFCGLFEEGHICAEKVATIVDGIMASKSLERVFLSIPKSMYQEEVIALALKKMIERNSTITALFLQRTCRCGPVVNSVDTTADAFAATVLEGLRFNHSITHFRLDSYFDLSDICKELLLDIVHRHRSLKKVHVNLLNPDYRLPLFLVCNRTKWVERLADVGASKRDRVQVFAEVQKDETIDKTLSTFHLLRGCPDSLM